MRGDLYQLSLVFLITLAVVFFGVFFYREIAPEYRIYQEDYVALEKFRSSITHEPPAFFKIGIKQIVIPKSNEGPETIDRCTSCHVALDLTNFSPTKVARDVNGNIIYDANGIPEKTPNEDYIFTKLDRRIAELTNPTINNQFAQQQDYATLNEREKEAAKLQALKTAEVNGRTVQMDKVLVMHPLIGRESRPFEYHPVDDYGCTSCHNGNGRALTSEKAHGPVFQGTYEESFEGPVPHFTEPDAENDPAFAHVFNHKPGHELLFQTKPLFVGGLVEANCVQCHQAAKGSVQSTLESVQDLRSKGQEKLKALQDSYQSSLRATWALLITQNSLTAKGYDATIGSLKETLKDFTLPKDEIDSAAGQISYLETATKGVSPDERTQAALKKVQSDLLSLLGSENLVIELQKADFDNPIALEGFIVAHRIDSNANGSLFKKADEAELRKALLDHIGNATTSFESAVGQETVATAMTTDIDLLTQHFQKGKELYLSQACFACHRIAGFARGGVGPELTREGLVYPWFVKESIVWPQADLKTSTMPNMRLDHEELEDLVTFLLAQKGNTQAISEVDYRIGLKEWENGKKLPWEQPLKPGQMHDLDVSMTVFVTEGCASCHRLTGFTSDVGFAIEKDSQPSWEALWQEREWFERIFPELMAGNDIPGSAIVERLDKYGKEIDAHIVNDVRKDSIIEKIERQYPGSIEALYSNFKFAMRAKNHFYESQIAVETNAAKKEALAQEWKQYKDRVHRVLMTYIQQYGLGRLIGPRPNWSGIYRSDEWLMEHFYNPSAHTAKSIMPTMPFDETKFYALMYMLDTLAQRNLKWIRSIWEHKGFNPELAYHLQCAQCHGENEQRADAPVALWIYPPPKNLRNSVFLRNLTPERVRDSIHFGVKGTPMPPWAECASDKDFENNVAVLKFSEVEQMVDWLFRSLPSETSFEKGTGALKWKYSPEDALHELENEGGKLKGSEETLPPDHASLRGTLPSWLSGLENVKGYLAKATPSVRDRQLDLTVEDVFDVVPSPVIGGTDEDAYYIKKKYYTPENLAEGQRLFIDNCSVCHGKEGAGNGSRAGSMVEAKPRMLTNLDWIHTRDDFRLLRSIKYGVPGTAMTPWGDLTSGLQRMQMVMFIRSLSQEKDALYRLNRGLYQSFETTADAIRNAHIEKSIQVDKAAKDYQDARIARQESDEKAVGNSTLIPAASHAHQVELIALENFRKWQAVDQTYDALLSAVEQEKRRYEIVGGNFLSRKQVDLLVGPLLEAIRLSGNRFSYRNGGLDLIEGPNQQQKIQIELSKIVTQLDAQVTTLQNASGDHSQSIRGLIQLKEEVQGLVGSSTRLRAHQVDLLQQLKQQLEQTPKLTKEDAQL